MNSKILLALTLVIASAFGWSRAEPGALVIVGGGSTPSVAVGEAIRLAGGPKAEILIVPWASRSEKRGIGSVEMYEEAGAKNVRNADDLEGKELERAFKDADLIWMPGGSQSRLIEVFRERELLSTLREAHARGCVVGGTSAGAAVLGDPMIAGKPDEEGIREGVCKLTEGLGLWKGVFVDQHFVERSRQTRLLTAVLDGPHRLGVGIGESTCVVVEGDAIRVLGRSVVQIYDAREASIAKRLGPGENLAVTGITLHVLRDGMDWRWAE